MDKKRIQHLGLAAVLSIAMLGHHSSGNGSGGDSDRNGSGERRGTDTFFEGRSGSGKERSSEAPGGQ